MKTISVKIEGISPLLHHRMTEEKLLSLLGPKAKKTKVHVEKTPRQIAEEHAYKTEDGKFYIPTTYVSGAFKGAASEYKQTSSKKTFKAIAGGIFIPSEPYAILTSRAGATLKDFEVDLKSAVNHKAGAVVSCRPRFDDWAAEFTVEIDDELLPPDLALQILQDAGRRCGIGSFRVAKGGPYGRFSVTRWEALN